MRQFLLAIIIVAAVNVGWAQDQTTNPDELNRKYQDALAQLNLAQERKNQLATENEKLTARVLELEKQLEQAQNQAATLASQTFSLRAHQVAWTRFIRRYPTLQERWRLFLESSVLAVPADIGDVLDPFSPLFSP
jgi:hypothetical protein